MPGRLRSWRGFRHGKPFTHALASLGSGWQMPIQAAQKSGQGDAAVRTSARAGIRAVGCSAARRIDRYMLRQLEGVVRVGPGRGPPSQRRSSAGRCRPNRRAATRTCSHVAAVLDAVGARSWAGRGCRRRRRRRSAGRRSGRGYRCRTRPLSVTPPSAPACAADRGAASAARRASARAAVECLLRRRLRHRRHRRPHRPIAPPVAPSVAPGPSARRWLVCPGRIDDRHRS